MKRILKLVKINVAFELLSMALKIIESDEAIMTSFSLALAEMARKAWEESNE